MGRPRKIPIESGLLDAEEGLVESKIIRDSLESIEKELRRTVIDSSGSCADRLRNIKLFIESHKMWTDVKNILSKK